MRLDVENLQPFAFTNASRLARNGGRATPCSVMMAATSFAGVISNAGLATVTPDGATSVPLMWVISRGSRSSMGMASPEGVARSTVLVGAAT